MALPIFTIQTFNQNTLQPAGAVFAQRVEAVSIARNFLAGITGVAGGRNTAMEKKMNDLTKALMEELQLRSKTAFPNAVALVDVKMHFSDIGKDDSNMFLAGQASATALIKRNKSLGSSMASSGPMAGPMAPPMAGPMAPPMAGPMAGPMAPPVAPPVTEPLVLKNNSRMLNGMKNPLPANFSARANFANPVKVGGKKSFINKSRKNRI